MSQGKIVEQRMHDELYIQDEIYHDLMNIQCISVKNKDEETKTSEEITKIKFIRNRFHSYSHRVDFSSLFRRIIIN